MTHLWAVAFAAIVGFLRNELVARYRIRVGRRIGSAALVADGLHARTDGFTSLAVLLGAGGVALGWRQVDPIIGLVITIAILGVLRSAIFVGECSYPAETSPVLALRSSRRPDQTPLQFALAQVKTPAPRGSASATSQHKTSLSVSSRTPLATASTSPSGSW